MAGSIRLIQAAFRSLLASGLDYRGVEDRIYLPGETVSSQLPIIKINLPTPEEKAAALGATRAPKWKLSNVNVEIYDKNPAVVDELASRIEDLVADNPNYSVDTVTIDGTVVNTTGRFYLLTGKGGTPNMLLPQKQQYFRSMIYNGQWLQTS